MKKQSLTWLLSGFLAASILVPAGAKDEQQTFGTPEQATGALVDACQAPEDSKFLVIFGPAAKELLETPDREMQRELLKKLAAAAGERSSFEKQKDGSLCWLVGKQLWPFPIPLVKRGDSWRFNTAAGKAEVIARRIGRDELQAMSMLETLARAQEEYASKDHSGVGVRQYAQRLVSTPGHHDGLYWPAGTRGKPSPMQNVVDEYKDYLQGKSQGSCWFGYRFKLLTRQGPNAAGGAYNYIINGNMIGGYGLVAWPAAYRSTGVTTFMLNHNGPMVEKDLGPSTEAIVSKMTEFNPDSSWRVVPPGGVIPPPAPATKAGK